MQESDLPTVLLIERAAYPFPWTHGNFLDSLHSGYESWVLRDESGAIAGYFLLMMAVEEAHLLNITVRPNLQGQGLGIMQLDKVSALARERHMESVLLEVRPSNQRALGIYEQYGFIQIGRRRAYYPAADNAREDAIVMRLSL
ncbi:ribosomal protein S18-alanine N-acetyltransferase [Noviherbaspirillum massiliense]|uniref:ribosomal protein S18-alanine N-acetyltransferase n=1 Tax=Noviherbaspirillum massiliense TaxID=1465823 RepID=UPI00036B44EA|nr:ribosomal protein S18-alanine N-acetyltransferase [Noviherbaspirillum massiliense]